MAMLSGAKRRRGLEEEEDEVEHEERLDRISRLPDGILGDIVTLLPTKDAARTQVLSSRWRHIWRSAPLNIDLPLGANNVTETVIARILSTHQGPCRRFSIPERYLHYRGLPAASLDGWLESPALDRLQELEFHYGHRHPSNIPPPLPASVHRFSSTLQAVNFGGCGFTDGNNASGLHFPVLKQLSLWNVRFSESSLRALLSACPVLQSLLLRGSIGFSRVQIASPTLRSIGVHPNGDAPMNLQLRQLIIEDAPCLERLLCSDYLGITVSVISAPELLVLGYLSHHSPRVQFGTTIIQGGSGFVCFKTVVHSVKVLSLFEERLSLDVVIEFMKCFPCLERLYIQTIWGGEKNVWCRKYRNLIGALDIRLKKIVLAGYRGNTSHVNFVKFFILNVRMLESMRLELGITTGVPNNAWIDKQHRLLQTKNKASRDLHLQLDFAYFASKYGVLGTRTSFRPEQVHDLSTADPFP